MRAWLARSGADLLAEEPAVTAGLLAAAQATRGHPGMPEQQVAWQGAIAALRDALRAAGGAAWTVALEYDLMRLEKRADAVVLTDRAILVLEFKQTDASPAALAEAEDYALDLRDFHAGSRAHPILPVLVSGGVAGFAPPRQAPLLWHGVLPPIVCGPDGLAALFGWVQSAAPSSPLDGAAWLNAPYRPVPGIVEAATMLFARHGVAEIAAARADAANLRETSEAIARAVAQARRDHAKRVVFVTGIPGAGKTLCGLNAVFGAARQDGAAFLTGNAPLVAVLREALARDAVARYRTAKAQALREVKAAIQNVHRFLEDGAAPGAGAPPERIIVFDEAQRAWDEAKARRGTQNRPGRLTMSEPAQTLDIMGRHPGWAVVVALIGNGQEINTGEAGLREWGRVIAADPRWGALAARRVLEAADPLQRLADGAPPWLAIDPALDLTVPLRAVRDASVAGWVEAVLAGDSAGAAAIARGAVEFPVYLSRDLDVVRAALRGFARGRRRAGLLRSSGAKRLRGDGLAAEVPAEDVADWFLNVWPDVRASDALEAAASEYACQGLELDVAGLAWGGDLVWRDGAWAARRFAGTRWQAERSEAHYVVNTYRVLLTRARGETVVWVPRGSAADDPFHDPTRDAAAYDAVAAFLLACGARPLTSAAPRRAAAPTLL
ncbi:DUF2075 domain-containing protein [Roseomonas alkaliterrae]|uniref:Schlafen group 3-like DNA/RNA helicase domain-containing protein n=1 Tax=Neoroseomonas alkaliterrae TaxID=1452450 RepID=A0A840Y780_9PROT|nr:DNA/RNA helicase domain-containing protein [Neoroseomonas alkaliterrae]MBB5690432.1 hypothetical protein [Neoroseomonas alkaliterrae]MBR0677164.1 DUF2075 domain-containing protein [Neoroseomonas alkaliterrae]